MLNKKFMLKQSRAGFTENVNQNRSKITTTRQPVTTDPITGDTVPDPTGTQTTHTLYCRITHERAQVPDDTENPAGLSTNLQRMLMSDWKNVPVEHDTFTIDLGTFEIGPVDQIYLYGGIIGYQAPLQES